MKTESARSALAAVSLLSPLSIGCAPAAPVSELVKPRPTATFAVTTPPPPSSGAPSPTRNHLAHASTHTCAIMRDGALYCWGRNDQGQVGVPEPTLATSAVRVPGLPKVVEVAVDDLSTCAVGADGGLYCFGYVYREGGGGGVLTQPTRVPGLEGVVSVALGDTHRCALFASGKVACSGASVGRLGGRADATPLRPSLVEGLPALTSIVASDHLTCGLDARGATWCFGEHVCGDDDVDPRKPHHVTGFDAMARLSVADDALCGVGETGDARCLRCEDHEARERRKGGTAAGAPSDPVPTPPLSGVRAISADARRGCVLDDRGIVSCWGALRRGWWRNEPRLADPKPKLAPKAGVFGVVEVSLTAESACALFADGSVRCWGENRKGELGAGSAPWLPTPDARPRGFAQSGYGKLFAVGDVTCGVVGDGRLECAGDAASKTAVTLQRVFETDRWSIDRNEACILGSGAQRACFDLSGMLDPTDLPPVSLEPEGAASSPQGACTYAEDGRVKCISRGEQTPLLAALNKLKVRDVVFGKDHACVVMPDASVRCAGDNKYGQLGRPGPASTTFQPVPGLPKVDTLVTGETQSCAMTRQSDVYCWGIDERVGERAGVDGRKPRQVLRHVSELVAGARHFCAISDPAEVWCWGSDEAGQLGDSPALAYRFDPVRVPLTEPARSLVAGRAHTCVSLPDSIHRCWGSNDYGQIGEAAARRYNDRAFVVAGLPQPRGGRAAP